MRSESDVKDVIHYILEIIADRARISIWWCHDGAAGPEAWLELGFDQAGGKAGIIYHDEDNFVPDAPVDNDLTFSDGYSADFTFPVLVPMDTAVQAVVSFYANEGGMPDGIQWTETWRPHARQEQ